MLFKNDTTPQKLVMDAPKCTILSVIFKKVPTLGGGPPPPKSSPARLLGSLTVLLSFFLNLPPPNSDLATNLYLNKKFDILNKISPTMWLLRLPHLNNYTL